MMKQENALTAVRGHVALCVASALLLWFSWDRYRSAVHEADQASNRTAVCRYQAAEIQRQRSLPAFIATSMSDTETLTRRIAAARGKAGFTEQMIDLVDPRTPERVSNSPYQLRPVAIALRGLSLRQLAQFVDALAEPATGTWVSRLRLTHANRDDAGAELEKWNAEVTLTQMIFAPIVAGPLSAGFTSNPSLPRTQP